MVQLAAAGWAQHWIGHERKTESDAFEEELREMGNRLLEKAALAAGAAGGIIW